MIDVRILKLMEQDKQKIKDGSLSFKQRFSFAPVSEGDIYLFNAGDYLHKAENIFACTIRLFLFVWYTRS